MIGNIMIAPMLQIKTANKLLHRSHVSLEGGYYYKAFATHYTTSRGSWTSESNMLWVP